MSDFDGMCIALGVGLFMGMLAFKIMSVVVFLI